MSESKNNNKKTVMCENFEVSVNMMDHPCGQTIKENSGLTINVNVSKSEMSIDRKKSFEKIYENNIWNLDGKSKSGAGSTKDATKQILIILNNVVDHLKLELQKDRISILDSSCGDMNWMPEFLSQRTDVDFTGYDITGSIIEGHKKKFNDRPWVFKQHDLVADPIQEKFDLIFSRHTLMHLFFTDIGKVWSNFQASGSSYLLMTSQSNQHNEEITDADISNAGRYRPVNFFRPPFSLPAPICVGKDTYEEDMYIILYKLALLPLSLF